MTHYDDTDAILAGWFSETAPAAMPPGLHDEVIARVRTCRQHRRWSAILRTAVAEPASRPTVRLGMLAVAVAAILVATLVWTGLPGAPLFVPPPTDRPPSADPVASRHGEAFHMPTRYTIPPGSGLREIGRIPEAIAFAVGPNRVPDDGDPNTVGGAESAFGGEHPDTGNTHGVLVAYAMTAWGHGSEGRVRLRSAPAEFLADMSDLLFGVELEPATSSTLAGRPALTTRSVPGMSSNHSDLHLDAKMTGLSGNYIIMTSPYRLIVADIDGVTVLVQIWSQTEEDLAAWLPVAQQFVDSIQFGER